MKIYDEYVIRLMEAYLTGKLDDAGRKELEAWCGACEKNRKFFERVCREDCPGGAAVCGGGRGEGFQAFSETHQGTEVVEAAGAVCCRAAIAFGGSGGVAVDGNGGA